MVDAMTGRFLTTAQTNARGSVDSARASRQRARLLAAPSVAALAFSLASPVFMPIAAVAQPLPAGCSDDGNANSIAEAGETITCLAPPSPISAVVTTVDDLTIVVGDAVTPTTISATGTAVNSVGGGALTLNVVNAGSSIIGSGGDGVSIENGVSGTGITVNAEGMIAAGGTFATTNNGIDITNLGTGPTSVNVATVMSTTHTGIDVTNGANSGDLTVTATGLVSGPIFGILATNNGSGDTTINVGDVAAQYNEAVRVFHDGTGGNVSVSSSGNLDRGLLIQNFGNGTTTVSANDATRGVDAGIYVVTGTAASDVSITATGDLDGSRWGVRVTNDGVGATSVNVNNASGREYYGISVDNASTTTDLSITATGLVQGVYGGIEARSNGTGPTTIIANDVLGTNYTGITVSSSGTDLTVTTTGSVSGGEDGISAGHSGSGALAVSVRDVTGTTRDGVGLFAGGTTTGLSLTATGDIVGGEYGVFTENAGTGATAISVTNVTGGNASGIYASSAMGSGGVSITATGDVTGASGGILVNQFGTGGISVSTANVTGGSGNGIDVLATSALEDILISSTGTVTAGNFGIYARNAGMGDTTIDVANVVASSSEAIRVSHEGTGGNVSVSASGLVDGSIRVTNDGTGTTTVSVNDVTNGNFDGVNISTGSNAGDVSVTATGTIDPQRDGVSVSNNGIGSTTINVNEVIGGEDFAINATNDATTTFLSITATGQLEGPATGLFAMNDGSGATSVNINGAIGNSGFGAIVVNGATATGLSFASTGSLSGDLGGLSVTNLGTGATSVAVTDVTGGSLDGIYASNVGAATTDLSVTATGAVSGSDIGVYVENFGTGTTTVAVADVTGMFGDGIRLNVGDMTRDVRVSAGNVSGANNGIRISADQTGATSVSAGNVTGTSLDGVNIVNFTTGTDITVALSGAAIGGENAVEVENRGAGAIDISVGSASSTSDSAIYARNDTASAGISITSSGAVSTVNGSSGIDARHNGSGDLVINSGGAVTGYLNGVSAVTAATGGATSITVAGVVEGREYGVLAAHDGAGDLAIAIGGAASALGDGVRATAMGGDLAITSTGAILAGQTGVYGYNAGTGATSVSITDAIATSAAGVIVRNTAAATGDIAVTATGDVVGGSYGVRVGNYGAGGVSISVHNVTATNERAVYVYNAANALGDVTVTATGTVSGATGILVDASRSTNGGDITVSANEVTATNTSESAISVSGGGSGSLTITTTGAISGAASGIAANNDGDGDVIVSATGPVSALTGVGIGGYSTGGAVTISSTGAITGGGDAISVQSARAAMVSVAGPVSGATGFGITTDTGAGATITVNAGGAVTGGEGAVNARGDAADTLNLAAGGSLTGHALLNGGDDIFNDASGAFTRVLGGLGTDTINFSGDGRSINGSGGAMDSLQGFEVFNFASGGFTLSGTHSGLQQANFLAGVNTLTGTLNAQATTIAAGATLSASDGASIAGTLTNNGIIDIAGTGFGTASVDSFSQGPGGLLRIDASATSNDLLVVTGAANLGGELAVRQASGLLLGENSQVIIDAGTAVNGTFSVVSGLLINQEITLDPMNFDVILTTTLNPASTIIGVTPNQSSVGDNLINLLTDPGLDADLTAFIFALGFLPTADDVSNALQQLSPQIVDGGLQVLNSAQSRFIDLAITQAGSGGLAGPPRSGPVRTAALNGGPVSVSGDGVNIWGAFSAGFYNQNADNVTSGFDGDVFEFAAGVSGIAAGPLTFGIAGGYSLFDGNSDGLLPDAVETNVYHIAASLRAEIAPGNLLAHVDSVVAYAGGDSDIVMNQIDPVSAAPLAQAGSANISSFAWRTRFTVDGWNGKAGALKPFLQAGLNTYAQDAVTIGTGASALDIDAFDQFRGEVGIGASYDAQWSRSVHFRGAVTGVRYFGDTANALSARFDAAPTGSPAFVTLGQDVRNQLKLDAALGYTHQSGFELSVGGFGEIGDLNLYGARIGLSKQF